MSLALAFKFTSTIAFIIKERINHSKHQMVISGMNIKAYWAANFIFDFFLYMVVASLSIGAAVVLEVSSLINNALLATWGLFILYGLCYVPFTYIVAFYLNEETSFFNLTLVTGGVIPVLMAALRAITASSNPVARGLCWLFRLYPSFAFGEGMINLGSLSIYAAQG
jgi:ATP-binding cassette, subfamily A (ABC1), member 3